MVEIVWTIARATHVISYGAWMSMDEVSSILTFDQNVEGKKEYTTIVNHASPSLLRVPNYRRCNFPIYTTDCAFVKFIFSSAFVFTYVYT